MPHLQKSARHIAQFILTCGKTCRSRPFGPPSFWRAEAAQMNGHIRPARRRWKGVQRDKSLWRRLRKTARRAGGSNGKLQYSRVYLLNLIIPQFCLFAFLLILPGPAAAFHLQLRIFDADLCLAGNRLRNECIRADHSARSDHCFTA